MSEWLNDSMPTLLGGTTGAGKTTMTRYLHESFPDRTGGASIFFNSDEEPAMGEVVRDVDELRDALLEGAQQVDVRIPMMSSRDRELFRRVVQFLMHVGQEYRGTSGPPQLQLLVDEVQEYSPSGSKDDAAITAAKRLRKRRIKPVFLTQEFPSTSSRLRSVQEWTVWLSPPPAKMHDFIRSGTQMDLEQLKDLPEYDALVHDKQMNAVARVRAPEEYAVE